MRQYVLGVDGGGSTTRAVILDQAGRLCGLGQAGPSGYDGVAPELVRRHIGQAVAEARRRAGLPEDPFCASFLGLAGVVTPQERAAVQRIAVELGLAPAERVGVDHDCRIALAGGLSGRPGIVQICGTGSSCYGRNAAGADWRAGGWGGLIGDEGSGYWLGVRAMECAVRAFDGRGPATCLEREVQQALELDTLNAIMRRVYVLGMTRAEIASLAPLVLQAAGAGDAVAQELIQRGAEELADCVLAVARRLGLAEGPSELALSGGIFDAGELLAEPLRRTLARRLPGCRISRAELPPVLGAGLLALQLAGFDPSAVDLQKLQARSTQRRAP